MYGILRVYKIAPTRVDEAVRNIKAGFLPRLRKAPGLRSYAVGAAPDGHIASVSTFADQSCCTAAASDYVLEHMAVLITLPTEVLEGELQSLLDRPELHSRFRVLFTAKAPGTHSGQLLDTVSSYLLDQMTPERGCRSLSTVRGSAGRTGVWGDFYDRFAAEQGSAAIKRWEGDHGDDFAELKNPLVLELLLEHVGAQAGPPWLGV